MNKIYTRWTVKLNTKSKCHQIQLHHHLSFAESVLYLLLFSIFILFLLNEEYCSNMSKPKCNICRLRRSFSWLTKIVVNNEGEENKMKYRKSLLVDPDVFVYCLTCTQLQLFKVVPYRNACITLLSGRGPLWITVIGCSLSDKRIRLSGPNSKADRRDIKQEPQPNGQCFGPSYSFEIIFRNINK